jgi:catechol 2,3-dioxygenase-like lactoylglutathione lyase family enzyme
MLKSFYHTGFVVRDIEESVAFYTQVMGLKLLFRTERTGEFIEKVVGFKGAHIRGAFLSMGNGHNLELIQYIVPPSAEGHINEAFQRNSLGATHLAFFVENIEDYYAGMSRKGLRFIGPPASLVQDGRVVRKAAYAQDPDNNWLEFVEVPQ